VTFKKAARALVTGAASGMGEASARYLLEHGVEVVAVDVNADGMSHLGC
jgi:NADP-dependent 3-hydroxy acid dehydrogenase YdfG